MSREWKPGDMAVVAGMRVFYTDGNEGPMFTFADGSRARADVVPADPARPLVVIDPKDRDEVARLVNLYEDRRPGNTRLLDHMTTALREFANPTPPKPAEPTGLGAVVEDADGNRWVRFCETSSPAWCSEPYDDEDYAEIDAVRVLSEGVTA